MPEDWRAVRSALGTGDSFSASASRYSADLDGMNLFWASLDPTDKGKISDLAKSDKYDFLDKKALDQLVCQLDKYCGKVSYLRLRFLSDNDNAFDLSDLRAELLVHGIQVVRLYEHTNDLKLIENYAKASIQNHAINLIQHFTSASRACVKNVTIGCGTCIFCLCEKPQRCAQAVADYRTTTLSTEGLSVGSLGTVESEADVSAVTGSLLQTLKRGATPEVQRLVDLVFGTEVDDRFEDWLESTHSTSVDKLLDNPKKLVKLLCSYFDLAPQQVNTHLRARYESFRAAV